MPEMESRIKTTIALMLFIMLTALSYYMPGHSGDIGCWRLWSTNIFEHGLSNAYDVDTNYPPLYQYIMWLFTLFQSSSDEISKNIGYLRAFTLLFEFWGIWMVSRWTGKATDFVLLLTFSMLNLSYAYNTLVWGQVDAILGAFVFAAFYFLHQQKLITSTIMLLLALNMKPQAIIFIPIYGLLVIDYCVIKRKWWVLVRAIISVSTIQFLILLPWILMPGSFLQLVKALTRFIGTYAFASVQAYNMWYWIMPKPAAVPDTMEVFPGYTYNALGFHTFCLCSLFAMIPLMRIIYQRLKAKEDAYKPINREVVWITAAVISILFFFCNTQMHERYTHPAFIFLTAYAWQSKKFGLYALFSVAYLLNMEDVLQTFRFRNYETLIFDPRFIAALFASCIIWCTLLLYRGRRTRHIDQAPI